SGGDATACKRSVCACLACASCPPPARPPASSEPPPSLLPAEGPRPPVGGLSDDADDGGCCEDGSLAWSAKTACLFCTSWPSFAICSVGDGACERVACC